MNSPKQIGDYFSRRFPFFTIFSNASYPELAFLGKTHPMKMVILKQYYYALFLP